MNPKRAQKWPKDTGDIQGTNPYLGMFLIGLVMLDSVMKDYLYGRLINLKKRRKELEVITQLSFFSLPASSPRSSLGPGNRPWSSSARL